MNWRIDLDMVQVFPNAYIAYRLLLIIPMVNCETETFKTFWSTMVHKKLSLSILSIEKKLVRSLNFDDLIADLNSEKNIFYCNNDVWHICIIQYKRTLSQIKYFIINKSNLFLSFHNICDFLCLLRFSLLSRKVLLR